MTAKVKYGKKCTYFHCFLCLGVLCDVMLKNHFNINLYFTLHIFIQLCHVFYFLFSRHFWRLVSLLLVQCLGHRHRHDIFGLSLKNMFEWNNWKSPKGQVSRRGLCQLRSKQLCMWASQLKQFMYSCPHAKMTVQRKNWCVVCQLISLNEFMFTTLNVYSVQQSAVNLNRYSLIMCCSAFLIKIHYTVK